MGNLKREILDALFFFGVITGGAAAVVFGYVEPYHEMAIATGCLYCCRRRIGVFMMLITDGGMGALREVQ